MTGSFDVEAAVQALRSAGWTDDGTVWKSPWGAYFRGPACAYRVMLAVKDNPIVVDTSSINF